MATVSARSAISGMSIYIHRERGRECGRAHWLKLHRRGWEEMAQRWAAEGSGGRGLTLAAPAQQGSSPGERSNHKALCCRCARRIQNGLRERALRVCIHVCVVAQRRILPSRLKPQERLPRYVPAISCSAHIPRQLRHRDYIHTVPPPHALVYVDACLCMRGRGGPPWGCAVGWCVHR